MWMYIVPMIYFRFPGSALLIWPMALLLTGEMAAQGMNLGVPPIWNFSRKAYQGGTQNWDMAQDKRGVLYVANNEGLLEYNGERWRRYAVPNKTVVRSVAVAADGRIFTGAQSEIGYFAPSGNGDLQYHSLVPLLPAAQRRFEDVWDIVLYGEKVFFRTNRAVFEYSPPNQMRIHEPGGVLNALFAAPGGPILQRQYTDLLRFDGDAFRPFVNTPLLNSALTACMARSGDSLLFSSLKDGLFSLTNGQWTRWPTLHDALLQKHRIYSAAALPNGMLALGTSTNGLVVLDNQRRIFRHLSQHDGLQNNNILHTFADRQGNLWLGLDNGIDEVVPFSPFTHIIPDADLHGTGYAAAISNGRLYLGVSNGAYSTLWKNYFDPEQQPYFERVGGSEGQVWSLQQCDAQLLMGHHEGGFAVAGTRCTDSGLNTGVWNFTPLSGQYLLSGTYEGLFLYKKSGTGWTLAHRIEEISESCRFVVKDADGSVWVSHPYRGLFRLIWPMGYEEKPEVQFFNRQNGLPSDLNNFVFSIAGKAVFTTEKGIFRFDAQKSEFIADEVFNRLLGEVGAVRYLREDAQGNIWYVSDRETGLLKVEDFGVQKNVRKRLFPDLNDKMVSGFEFIFPADTQNVFFGAEQGFVHYHKPFQHSADTTVEVFIDRVTVGTPTHDSVLFAGWWAQEGTYTGQQPKYSIPALQNHLNQLIFYFTAPHFANPPLVQYRSRLNGFNETWSEWSPESVRHFTNLSPGTYRFEVQARYKNTWYSPVAAYSFRINAPWYATPGALLSYMLLFTGALGAFWHRQKRRFEREKQSLEVQHRQITDEQQRAVAASQAAVSDILREKLEAELQFKNQELATATMHLVQKGEILQTIHENLNQILQQSTNPAVKKEIQQLLNLLNFDATLDEDWAQFARHFDQVHVDFLKRVREQHPHLSSTDYKLCAYLRMNLSTKEIAPLMNISVRGVEASRYRLRKKLGLPNDANLTEVIFNI